MHRPRMHSCFFCVLFWLAHAAAMAQNAAPAVADRLQEELDDSVAEYNRDLQEVIESVAKTVSLKFESAVRRGDINLVNLYGALRAALRQQGELPGGEEFASVVKRAEKSRDRIRQSLERAYDHVVSTYTQNRKFDKANAAEKEWLTIEQRFGPRLAMIQRPLPKPRPEATPLERVFASMEHGATWTNSLGMKMVLLKPGEFLMGTPPEAPHNQPLPQKKVRITKGYLIAETEVTQEQWKAVVQSEPWKDQKETVQSPNSAASYINWDEAQEFCRRLTERDRKAGLISPQDKYQLPTEAQWEYACRAGTASLYSFGDNEGELHDYAWNVYTTKHRTIPEEYPHEVRQKKPNRWGLYDMHGNVEEWCFDFEGSELPGGDDPTGVAVGSERLRRGGAYFHGPVDCRSNRGVYGKGPPTQRTRGTGLRVVLVKG